VIDVGALQIVLSVLTGWLDRQERAAVAYLTERTASCGVNWVDVGCVSPTTIAAGWRHERTASAERPCGRLPPLRRPTPYSGGTAS